MKNIKILHTADLHLDSAFEALPAGKAAIRRAEQRELLSRLAELARSERVDVVLLAGDIFDGGGTYFETGAELVRCLWDMSVPVFIAPGNHDPYDAHSPYAKLDFPQNVKIFTERDVECAELPELGVRVYGAAFTGPEARDLLTGFSAERDGLAQLMVLHGDAVNNQSPYNYISKAEIAGSGLDYLALGHVHACSGVQTAEGTAYAYPGCPEGRGFDELGDKGFLVGQVDKGSVKLRFVPFALRRYELLSVDVTGRTPLEAIREALPVDTERDIYRVLLTGETDGGVDIPAITEELASRFYALEVRDRTTVQRDIWDGCGEDSLRGLFLQKMRERYDTAQDESERRKLQQAVRFALAAMENRDI